MRFANVVENVKSEPLGKSMITRSEADVVVEQAEWYDIVRRSDGVRMGSFPAGGRYLVYSKNGLVSLRPLLDDESVFNLSTASKFMRRLGYHITPPADNIISTV